ncbi:LysR family transcriptional regulator [Mesorhizobium sp. L-8-3]|uniref:LysR family transcriptional regulator n=1 Tax=Mesorhizobium sp. L-8-3 TaxID=2744522 RepID=UPI001928DBCE|nr:LysR family transcriptional regulator [Mesorhizobium sp. L-8-3]BCH21499.1 transcriptional regulator [Mesorhizobium sp. L-8-3]
MRFKNLDLNLLVALDLLLAERNVSRAADKMNITQSAMSNALARLRSYFDDPLLTPVGRSLELTPRAESMRHSVRDIIVRVEAAISTDVHFDPSQTARQFSILLSDYSMTVLMPKVLALAELERSRAQFQLLPQIERPEKAIERGEADLVIAPKAFISGEHPSESLFEDGFVCAAWKDGRYGKAPLTKEQYLEAGHIRMMPPERGMSFDMMFLEERGIARRIEVTCYSFAAMPHLIVGTDRLATIHGLIAAQIATSLPIVCHEVPLPMVPLQQCVQWHQYKSQDPGILWLRRLIQKAARMIDSKTGSPPVPG